MELRWLEDYIALARTRHFSRAAEAQNITQPTFSRRIKLLEDEMGVVLVDRNTLPLSLTAAGEIFLQFAERTVQQLRYTREQFDQIKQRELDTLVVAATQTLYLCFYQDWVERCSAGAELSFNLNSSSWSSAEFASALGEGRADICLCHWHPHMHPLELLAAERAEHVTLARDRLLPLSWAQDGEPLHQFPGTAKRPLPYIDYQQKSYFHGILQDHLQQRSPALQLLTMNRNMQSVSVKALVMEGYGVGWLPERLAARELQAGLLAVVSEEDAIELEVRAYRSLGNDKPQLARFWSVMQQQASGPAS